MGIKKALIIAVSEYDIYYPLKYCEKDGVEISKLLASLEYNIEENNKLIGYVSSGKMRDVIVDFFNNKDVKQEDMLLFYYSGHGIKSDQDGTVYLSPSEIDPELPIKRGFPFNDFTTVIQNSVATKIVAVLDCCHSGSAKIGKGQRNDSTQLIASINEDSKALEQGEGKCILAASQPYQGAYPLEEQGHSIFTYYLLEGFRGNEESVDSNGYVTPYSLNRYISKKINSLPAEKRPRQKPLMKSETSGEIILASYRELRRKTMDPVSTTTSDTKNGVTPATSGVVHKPPALSTPSFIKKARWKYRLTVPILIAVAVGIIVALGIIVVVLAPLFIKPQPPTANHYSLLAFWIYLTGNRFVNGDFPDRIAVDSGGGNVYVADYGNNRIEKFDGYGYFFTKWGAFGSPNGQFNGPNGVAVDSGGGNVYVSDFGNARIQKFDSTGHFITKWGSNGTADGQFEGPESVAVDSGGNVYVSDFGNARIQKFDSTGHFITKWGSIGSADGQFEDPGSVAVDHFGNVYVADAQIDRIQKFDSTGHFITKWGRGGSDNGQFQGISSIAVDSTGNVYVADGNARIQKFDSTGHFITKWGSNGTAEGQFQSISSIAVDLAGNVYVADLGKDHRIQVFTPT